MINKIFAPRINANDDEIQVLHWHVNENDYARIGEPIVDIETSKANVTVESDFNGHVFNLAKNGEIVPVGKALCLIGESLEEINIHKEKNLNSSIEITSKESLNQKKEHANITTNFDKKVLNVPFNTTRFSNRAKGLVQSLKLDPSSFVNMGLITSKLIFDKSGGNRADTPPLSSKSETVKVEKSNSGPITPRESDLTIAKREEISQLTIGESGLINSTLSITFNSLELRNAFKNKAKLQGSIQPVILFEISQLLVNWPQFTAYFQNNQIHFYDRIDLGIAIDLGMGLKVVRIKDAELKSVEKIETLTLDFCLKYMRKELQPEDLFGSTITVTDLSSLDILYFHPLINGYQSAIIGIGGDSSLPDHPTSICMTFDHRISTGREVATFLKQLKANILNHITTSL